MLLELRCCCDPNRLFGMIEVPDYLAREDQDLNFTMRRPVTLADTLEPMGATLALIRLTVRRIRIDSKPSRLAVASNDTPIEILRQLPGFHAAGEPA